jgi:protein-tyrosine phosphatase
MILAMENRSRRVLAAIAWRLRCHWAALNADRWSRRVLAARPIRKLLVVCYGNIYRSPYVAELLRERLANRVQVRSSGFHPIADRPSPSAHVQMSAQAGVDLGRHRSAQLSFDDLAWADAIVLMDRYNWRDLRRMGADPGRLVWLGSLDGGGDIPDPYGLPLREAERIMQRVHRCSESLAAAVLAQDTSAPS